MREIHLIDNAQHIEGKVVDHHNRQQKPHQSILNVLIAQRKDTLLKIVLTQRKMLCIVLQMTIGRRATLHGSDPRIGSVKARYHTLTDETDCTMVFRD